MRNTTTKKGPLIALPLKPFRAGLRRLESVLTAPRRARLSRALADRVADACVATGARTVVVTRDAEVAAWARRRSLDVAAEPPAGGLIGAAEVAAEAAAGLGLGWCIVHGDLPLLRSSDVTRFIDLLDEGTVVLAPSRDGGTNLLASIRPLEFHYGPGSFARHLASARHMKRRVLVTAGTVLDLDTPADLYGAARLARGAWLTDFLS
jgi:2-phospho-L-lactate guanylyltransferase